VQGGGVGGTAQWIDRTAGSGASLSWTSTTANALTVVLYAADSTGEIYTYGLKSA
jgi:hypothetical protein